jgi:hypothetical protein
MGYLSRLTTTVVAIATRSGVLNAYGILVSTLLAINLNVVTH